MTKSLRFLIVEDEVMIAMCLELELKQEGHTVCNRVGSGEEALACIKENLPDVILMDIRLAGDLDGIETARQIHNSLPIPIIFMTGYPDEELTERVIQENPIGFFAKPIRIQDIQSAINSIA